MLSEEVIDAAWQEIYQRRQENEALNADLGSSFQTKVLGGKWTRLNKPMR